MESSLTRKRSVSTPEQVGKYFRIYEEVYFLAKIRYDIPRIADPISITLRAAILCDLVYSKSIKIEKDGNEDKVYCCGAVHGDAILEETMALIRDKVYTLNELLTALNGESFMRNRKMHLKKVRERTGKKFESLGLLSYKNKGRLFKGDVTIDLKTKEEMINDVFSFLEGDYDVRRMAVVGCLMYFDGLKPLFLSQPVRRIELMRERSANMKKKFMAVSTSEDIIEKNIYTILRCLHKL